MNILRQILQWSPKSRAELRSTAWLDGLRGLAAFEVLIYHYVDFWINPEPGYGDSEEFKQFFRLPFFRSAYDSGRAMVCTFFVISGFVLTQRSLKLLRAKDYSSVFTVLSSAIFRRGIRLFGPVILPLMMGFILVRLGKRGGITNDYLPYYESFWTQLVHWFHETMRYLSIFRWYGSAFGGDLMHKYEAVVWTLPMEFYCSMAIYVILLLTARMTVKTRRIVCIVIALYALIQFGWAVSCFSYGMALGDAMIDNHQANHTRTVFYTVCLLLGIFLAGAPQRGLIEDKTSAFGYNWWWALLPESYFKLDVNYTGWAFSGMLITTAASQLYYVRRLLEGPLCQYLGKISFALYLNHVWIRDLFGHRVQWHTLATLSARSFWYGISWAVWMIVMVFINFFVAAWFERLVDAPVVRFGKTLETYFTKDETHSYEL